jgi:hypothetical protein
MSALPMNSGNHNPTYAEPTSSGGHRTFGGRGPGFSDFEPALADGDRAPEVVDRRGDPPADPLRQTCPRQTHPRLMCATKAALLPME